MTYVITEPCAGCKDGSCVEVCPVDAIHLGNVVWGDRNHDQLFIDPTECIGCGICVTECPVDAIYPDDEVPEQWKEYIAINAKFYGR